MCVITGIDTVAEVQGRGICGVPPHLLPPPPGAVIAALNGLSGVMRLEGNIEGAIAVLRDAVRVMEENKAVGRGRRARTGAP